MPPTANVPDDDDDLRERQPAFYFNAEHWLRNPITRRMNDQQRGWFIQLLAEAWLNGDPQATLPSDEDELKRLAGFTPVLGPRVARLLESYSPAISPKIARLQESGSPATNSDTVAGLQESHSLAIEPNETGGLTSENLAKFMLKLEEEQENRWAHVRKQFIPSTVYTGYLHNVGLTNLLLDQRAVESRYRAGGRMTAAKRWGEQPEPSPSPSSLTEPGATGKGAVSPKPTVEQQTGTLFTLSPGLDPVKQSIARNAAEVFDFWKLITGHKNAIFGKDRKARVETRLREGYTVEQLKAAVQGCRASAHNQGDNERGQVYDDLELICRSSSIVERFINVYNARGKETPNVRETAADKRARVAEEQAEYVRKLQRGSGSDTAKSAAIGLQLDPSDFG